MFGLRRIKRLTTYTDIKTGVYRILLFRNINGSYVQVEKLKHKVIDTKFTHNHKDFKFDAEIIAYSDEKYNYYAFDFDLGTQLTFNKKRFPKDITIDEIDTYVNRGIIAQIISGLEKRKEGKGQWLIVILGAVMGGAIGFIIGQQLTPKTPIVTVAIISLLSKVFI